MQTKNRESPEAMDTSTGHAHLSQPHTAEAFSEGPGGPKISALSTSTEKLPFSDKKAEGLQLHSSPETVKMVFLKGKQPTRMGY